MEKDILTARARNLVSKGDFERAGDKYQKAAEADVNCKAKIFVGNYSVSIKPDYHDGIIVKNHFNIVYLYADGNDNLVEQAETVIDSLGAAIFAPVGVSGYTADWRKLDSVISRVILSAIWRLKGELPILDAAFVLGCGRRRIERNWPNLLNRVNRAVYVAYPSEGEFIG